MTQGDVADLKLTWGADRWQQRWLLLIRRDVVRWEDGCEASAGMSQVEVAERRHSNAPGEL